MSTTEIKRAPFSSDLEPLRKTLAALLPKLEAQNPKGYSSIFFERRTSKVFSANFKQTQVSDQMTQGVVFRIYDGFTLYEEATDELDPQALEKFAAEFTARVKSTPPPAGAVSRPYAPPTWKDRTAGNLESEITSQIPKNPKPETPVHFGIRFQKDPKAQTAAEALEAMKKVLGKCKELAPKAGLAANDLTYVVARQTFVEEQSIFIDRESNLSQTLYRVSCMVVTMAGSERTFLRPGGLGGLEIVELKDEELLGILGHLKSLKNAARLEPGKYKVLFGPVLSGVLAHEAFGHSQEGDTCARGRSKAWDLHRSGENVGNENATILNNPAVFENADQGYAAWGTYFFDEEGWLARSQVLLEKGVLKSPMTNLTSALRLGVPRSANGKRESWANGVYTRQTNTYFSAGDKTVDELMTSLGDGYLARFPAGGMEDPKGMGIQVGISFLEEVKAGKLTGRVFKGPAGGDIQMTGYTPDILNSIVAKSKIEAEKEAADEAKHPFNDAGGCGKYHKEFVYAGCGGPYMLIKDAILG